MEFTNFATLKTKFVVKSLDAWRRTNPSSSFGMTPELYSQLLACEESRLRQVEVDDAVAKAYLKALADQHASIIRRRIALGDFNGMPEIDALQPQLAKLDAMEKLKNANGNGGALNALYFVTINAKPGVTVAELTKKVTKYVNRVIVKKAEWVYEQRGTSALDMGTGLHVHLLVAQRGDVFDGEFKQNTRSTFGPLVGLPEKHVDIRVCKPEWVNDKREYMKGVKTADGKMEKCAMDTIWRLANNISPYYTHENGQAQYDPSQPSPSEAGTQDEHQSAEDVQILPADD